MQTQSATFVTTQLSSHNSTGVLGQYIVATMMDDDDDYDGFCCWWMTIESAPS